MNETYEIAKKTILESVEDTIFERFSAVKEDINEVEQKVSSIDSKVENISAIVQDKQESFNDKLTKVIETSNSLKDAIRSKDKEISSLKSDLTSIKDAPKPQTKVKLKDIEDLNDLVKGFEKTIETQASVQAAKHVSQPLTTQIYSDGTLIKGSVTKINFLGGIATLTGDTVNVSGGSTYTANGTLTALNYVPTWSPTAPTLATGLNIRFFPDVNNPANATFNNVLIKKPSSTGLINLEADDLMGGGNYELTYNGTSWVMESNDEIDYVLVTGTSTINSWNKLVEVDATLGSLIINLPSAVGNTGKSIFIKRIDNTTNTVTIDANALETIDGATTIPVSYQYSSISLMSNGTNIDVVGKVMNMAGKSYGLISLSALTPLTITHNLNLPGTFRSFSYNFMDTATGQDVHVKLSNFTANTVDVTSSVTINLNYTFIG